VSPGPWSPAVHGLLRYLITTTPTPSAHHAPMVDTAVSVGPHKGRKPENSYSRLSFLTWSNPAPRRNTPVDNSQNPTNKAKNQASQATTEIFTFV
jgi:hypothetical protein